MILRMLLNLLKKTYQNFFENFILHKKLVSLSINENEIFIRIITSPKHHKEGNSVFAERKEKELFLPYRGGVSMNRYIYISEKKIKNLAKSRTGREKYVGFAIFSKQNFDEVLIDYIRISNNNDFHAHIEATPLDINDNIIKDQNVYTTTKGNPSHADIIYNKNPQLEKPNSSIRQFSKKLARKAIKEIDMYPKEEGWLQKKFSDYFI